MFDGIIDFSWTLFLDRDGVINTRLFGDYIKKKEDFHFLPGVLDFLKFAKDHFHKIIVVTNQQGVGKRLMTELDLEKIHEHMINQVSEYGGRIDAIYVATNLKNDILDIRKPKSNMAFKAKSDFPSIEFSKSFMIGDTTSDILFGKNLGMKTVLVKSDEVVCEKPDFQVFTLNELIF